MNLEDYPQRTFTRRATITYIDPCISPDFFSADPTELQLGPSFYNETTPYEVIAANYFTIEPSFCEITYSCTTPLGQSMACDGDVTSFDPLSSVFNAQLSFEDYNDYPATIYYFTFRGTAG